ncbi:MAG: hypothetical protein ACREL5_01865, partial [Gemmatimonadales bacterium]
MFGTAALLATTICHGAHGQRPAGKPLIDTLQHGIVRIRNTAPTAWTGTSGWRLILERTIAPPEGSTALLAEPYSLAVDRNGEIFEADWKVDGIQVFAADGRYLRTLGRKGNGPGEFQVPIEVAIRGDTLAAYASNQNRVSLWRTSGKLLVTWTMGYCCWWSPRLEAGGALLLRTSVRVASRNRPLAVRWASNGTPIDTIWLPPVPEYPGWRDPHGGVFTIPFTARVVGTFDSRDSYISGFGGRYNLVVTRNGSDTVREVELPGKPAPVPPAVADSMFKPYAASPPTRDIARRGDIPTEQPFFTGLATDEHDNVWISRPGTDGSLASFDVIDSRGWYLGSVAAPPSRCRLMVFRNDRMF